MPSNTTIVQKYGGVCLETPAKIRAVASGVADLHGRGHRVVAIVSAMGKTTDELVRMAYQISPHPNRRELDMLLTTGERISMSLMSMALSDLGVPAISFRRRKHQHHDDLRFGGHSTHCCPYWKGAKTCASGARTRG
ncbi:hypothetical protein [Bradyrhizobium erythrophlei]|uniref:aspartate kinase n=1 Tax=Bradyrhizobium erythrophlei TaxID=1437360 RepID=A0A1H4Y7N2_9BRAD|nr:hypothetical protein [Bradyrhizobium erythrophlei]SED13098.1 aspartate kinase [Bradyrhizobium erythrophlei]